MKITVSFDNPLNTKQKIKKTFTVGGNKRKQYVDEFLKMADDGMVIIPMELTISQGDREISQNIILSTPVVEKGYRGNINQRPKEKTPEVKVIPGFEKTEKTFLKEYDKLTFNKSWWRKILGL